MAKAPSRRMTRPAGAGLDPAMQALYENIEILNGARGTGMDRAVLLRDLVDIGLIRQSRGKVLGVVDKGTGVNGDGAPLDPTVELPTKPDKVVVTGGFSNILIDWQPPGYKGHAYAEIFRSDTDDFSKAVSVGTTAANLYSDQTGGSKVYFYWVRFVNKNDIVGPIQSTSGIRGETQGDIQDILDALKGGIDESFLTPGLIDEINQIGLNKNNIDYMSIKIDRDIANLDLDNKLSTLDGKFEKQIKDTDVKFDKRISDLDSKLVTDLEELESNVGNLELAGDILQEAVIENAINVDNEGDERRKVTAEIKLTQKTIITDQGAMAQQILEINAKSDKNEAAITENKTAIIKNDADTQKTIEAVTQRLDSQKSVIDQNKAGITANAQTIIKVNDDAQNSIKAITIQNSSQQSEIDGHTASIDKNAQSIVKVNDDAQNAIKVVTIQNEKQQSELDGHAASIESNRQTSVKIDGEVKANSAEIASVDANSKRSVELLTTQLNEQKSEIDSNKASITTNSQTIVRVDGDVINVSKEIDATNKRVQTISETINTQKSEIDGNKASITSQAQTIVDIDGRVKSNANEIGNVSAVAEATTKRVDAQQSVLDSNTASIKTNASTLVRIDDNTQANANKISEIDASTKKSIESITEQTKSQQSEIDSSKAQINTNSQTIAEVKNDTDQSLKAMTTLINDQKSEIDGNKASIAANTQTSVRIDGELQGVKTDLSGLELSTNKSIESLTKSVNEQKSEVDSNKASISSNSQTLVTVGNKVDDTANDLGRLSTSTQQSIKAITEAASNQQSEIDDNKASIASNSQTIVDIGRDTQQSIRALTTKQDVQQSDIDGAKSQISINTQTLAQLEKDGGEDSGESDILAEAVMETTVGVDAEGSTRRRMIANIKTVQKTIVTEQQAMAQQIFTVNAKADDNTANITETRTAIVKLSDDTQKTLESVTQRLDEQKSLVDGNSASIRSNSETIIRNLAETEDRIKVVTNRLDSQKSEIDSAKAEIDSNKQTILKVDSDTKQALSAMSTFTNSLKSAIDGNTSTISNQAQTIINIEDDARTQGEKIDVITNRIIAAESNIGSTSARVTENTKTIATINADGSEAYKAQWGVKASVGYITAGIGLTAKSLPDGTTISQCTVVAGQFSVGYIKNDGRGETAYPFIVKEDKVFIDTAFIKAATIQELVAGEVVADTVRAGASITAPIIKGGKIDIGNNFSVDENGNLTASNATLSGNITATAGLFRGRIEADSGYFKGDITGASGTFSGTVQARHIIGDIVSGKAVYLPAQDYVNQGAWIGIASASCGASSAGIARMLYCSGISLCGTCTDDSESLDVGFEWRVLVNGNQVAYAKVIMPSARAGIFYKYSGNAIAIGGGSIGAGGGSIEIQIRRYGYNMKITRNAQTALFSLVPHGTEFH